MKENMLTSLRSKQILRKCIHFNTVHPRYIAISTNPNRSVLISEFVPISEVTLILCRINNTKYVIIQYCQFSCLISFHIRILNIRKERYKLFTLSIQVNKCK